MSLRSCSSFIIRVVDVAGAVRRARLAIRDGGGECSDDDEHGTFSGLSPLGEIEGTYATFSDSIAVTILRKPWLVPCGLIRERVQEYFR